MRALLQGRAGAIATTLAQAKKLARSTGESVSGAVGDQVVQTLRAAMASDEAAAAVLVGNLTEALDEPGFGGSSIGAAERGRSPERSARSRAEPLADVAVDRAAEEAAERAARRERMKSATSEVRRAEKLLAAVTKRCDGLARDRDRLVSQLAQIENDLGAARAQVDDATAELSDATTALEAAQHPD